jgi:hypothetical protein
MARSDESEGSGSDTGLAEVAISLRRVWYSSKRYVIHWVKRRNLVFQFVIAGAIAEGVGWVLNSADGVPESVVANFSSVQVLLAILGVLITQTAVQTRKFNQVRNASVNMANSVRPDGGRRNTIDDGQTSGGGALGGAIAGGALGAAYGPQGAVAGAILGAILGDNLEDDTDVSRSRPPRDPRDRYD